MIGVSFILWAKYLFRIWAAVLIAYGHKNFGNFDSINNACAIWNKVLHELSPVPFWCGEYGHVYVCFILFLIYNSLNSQELYSPPLSVQRNFISPIGAA